MAVKKQLEPALPFDFNQLIVLRLPVGEEAQ
jgi:hypothetical protein